MCSVGNLFSTFFPNLTVTENLNVASSPYHAVTKRILPSSFVLNVGSLNRVSSPLFLIIHSPKPVLFAFFFFFNHVVTSYWIVPRSSVSINHALASLSNENVRNIGQGEARHKKYKRLKLGGGQAYDRSSV
jgi:hypothetical protein